MSLQLSVRCVLTFVVRAPSVLPSLPFMHHLSRYLLPLPAPGTSGLYDMVMIKDNHIAAAGGIAAAVEGAEVRSY